MAERTFLKHLNKYPTHLILSIDSKLCQIKSQQAFFWHIPKYNSINTERQRN